MADNQKLRVDIIGDASSLNQSLGRAEGRLKTFSGKLKNIGRTLTTRVTLPLALAGGAAIKLASDMEESLNKVDVSFGNSSEKVKEFAKTTLREFGIAEGSALEMTALFGDMATGMGISQEAAADMSTELAGLAGDLASFKNIRIDVAQTALVSVFNGETESLKRLGIVMTQANLESFALTQGINKQVSEMTEAEKINLRLAFVMDRTKNAQGDFARTSGGAANQMRIFQESIKEVSAELGQILLPTFTKVVTKLNTVLKRFRELSDDTKELIINLGIGAGLTGVITYLVGTVLPPFLKGLRLISGVLLRINPIVLAITAALTAMSIAIQKIADKTSLSFFETLKNLVKSLGSPFAFAANTAKSMANNLSEVEDVVEDLGEDIPKITTSFEEGLNNVVTAGRKVVSTVNEITSKGVELGIKLKNNLEPAISGLESFASQILPQVGQALTDGFAAIAQGENPIKRIGTLLVGLIARLVAAAAAAFILSTLLGGVFGIGSIAGTLTSFQGLFAAFSGVALANGGIITGPTVAMMGEYSGVRSNPEVVAPLNKLKAMIGGGSQNVSGEFVLRGQDLVVALQRAEKSRNRIL
jgi:hypothetical protein